MPTQYADPAQRFEFALAHSRYLQRLYHDSTDLVETETQSLGQVLDRTAMLEWLAQQPEASNEDQLKSQLRRLRQRVMGRLYARDLGGLATLEEVITVTTDLAEVALAHAHRLLRLWLIAQFGSPIGEETNTEQEMIVVGMGKLGGGELNVSSDIDLIFIYPEDGNTNGNRQRSNHEFFTQLGRKLINALNDATAEGFVFRVDMRLRPYGDSGPLVSSFAALEAYLHTQGREWERYAWIKGRALCGDQEGLVQIVRPFVFRKYLDFGAYGSMRNLHVQIRREVARKEMQDNIKLGPGGIREIEFIAQVFQLIRGGRDRALQVKPTRTVLRYLASQQLLSSDTVDELIAAYEFLRNLEHRLQYLEDGQTQTLPRNEVDRQLIAETMGFADFASFMPALDAHRQKVTRHFEQVFSTQQDETEHRLEPLWSDVEQEQTAELLQQQGYNNGEEARSQLLQLRLSGRYQQLPEGSRHKLDKLLPPTIEVAASFHNPEQTLERMLRLLEAICRREAYLSLLVEHPQTLKRIATLYSASPWVSAYLTQHPILLDELLDARLLYAPPQWPELATRLVADLDACHGDSEQQMDILRHFQHTQIFRLVSQDLAEQLTLETLSDHLSDLADLILAQTLRCCWANINQRHREQPAFAIIGYGKLGGKELGYASDLDIIFLYEDEHESAGELYAKLAKRINTWLTTLTPAGMLYDVDLRLRPNGASGLLVSSTAAFDHYQKKEAWLWEHQALTRARFVAGDSNVAQRFAEIKREVLMLSRDQQTLRDEVYTMRHKMLDNKLGSGNLDIKHARGGIIDVEFCVQYLVLAHSARYPELADNVGNIALLHRAAEAGLIDKTLAAQCRDAYRCYRRLQHRQRLNQQEAANESAITELQPHFAAVKEMWLVIFGKM